MHDQISSVDSEAHALLDQAVLNLMLCQDRQRPWSEAELTRMLSTLGRLPASLERLRMAGLIHRWNDLVTASHAAVYYHEITQSIDPSAEGEHHWDSAVLESLIVRGGDGEGPLSEQDLWDGFDAKDKKHKLRIADALNRLDGAGLIERRCGRSIASEVAHYLDRIMTL